MTKEVVLKYLQKHGQKIDHEIVKDTGIDLKELRKTISELQSKNLIQTCTIIQHALKVNSLKVFSVVSQAIRRQQRQAEKHLQHHLSNLN